MRYLLVLLFVSFCGIVRSAELDPVTTDPVVTDPAFPPAMVALKIPSGGTQINSLIYRAAGPGKHAVVILCHGYPGNEKNLDLAQAMRRAGYHVVWFNYRGSWASGGTFTMANALEDARNVVAFIRTKANADRYGLDPEKIAIAGHSFGGWVALMLAAEDAKIAGVVTLAPWNPVVDVTSTEGAPKERAERIAGLEEFDRDSGPMRGSDGATVFAEIVGHQRDYDYFAQADRLKSRPLLLIAASRDEEQPLRQYHEPLVQALNKAQAPRVEVVLYEDDHPFSAHRVALCRKVCGWLRQTVPPQ